MMKTAIKCFLALGALHLTPTLARPTLDVGKWGDWKGGKCISDAQAAEFVQNIQDLYHCTDPELAKRVLTADFKSYSYTSLRESGTLLQDGNNVFASSRDDFIQVLLASDSTCDDPLFRTLKVWNGCNIVGFWWSLKTDTDPPYEFVGIDILEIDVAAGKIKADYSEFGV